MLGIGRRDHCCCGPAARLLFCLIGSFVLHLSFLVSGTPYPRSTRVDSAPTSVTIRAVLVSAETQSQSEVRLSAEPGRVVDDGVPLIDTGKAMSSPDGNVVSDSRVGTDINTTGLIDLGRYYVRSELSQAPHVINDIVILAPPTKGSFAWKLLIRLFLSESGLVDRVMIEESTAPAYVEEEAVEQFRSARYSPGYINGQRVKSQLLIDVTEP